MQLHKKIFLRAVKKINTEIPLMKTNIESVKMGVFELNKS